MARPTKYKTEYVSIARKMCEMGATLADLSEAFEVSISTISLWSVQHEEFSAALRIGREPSDDKVERSLYERAIGYSHPDTDIRVVNGEIVKTEIIKHYPPDTKAALAWLYNRRSTNWHPLPDMPTDGKEIIINIVKPDGND